MPVTFATVTPKAGDLNVPLNAEVVFRLINTTGVINLSSLTVDLTIGVVIVRAIENGVFVNEFGGEFIDNQENGTDITVVIIRPPTDPEWPQGSDVNVGIDVDLV